MHIFINGGKQKICMNRQHASYLFVTQPIRVRLHWCTSITLALGLKPIFTAITLRSKISNFDLYRNKVKLGNFDSQFFFHSENRGAPSRPPQTRYLSKSKLENFEFQFSPLIMRPCSKFWNLNFHPNKPELKIRFRFAPK